MDPHRASQRHIWYEGGLLAGTGVCAFVHYSKVAMVSSYHILTMGISKKDGFWAFIQFINGYQFRNLKTLKSYVVQ